jgi:hypothetical protein
VRSRPRDVILEHAEVDRLNGRVNPTETSYRVNGWTIDPASDPVLRERLEKVWVAVEEILPAERLELPEDPRERAAKLNEIAKLQEKLLTRVFTENFVEHPGNNAHARTRMTETLARSPELRGKIGAVIESQCGICTDQAATMSALLNEVEARTGISVRAIRGTTIRERAGHGFNAVRLANGQLTMLDATWHFEGDHAPLDNMEFSTWEGIQNSNREINSIGQETSRAAEFVDPASREFAELARGYTAVAGEAVLLAMVRERIARGQSPDRAAKAVLRSGSVETSLSAAELAGRASGLPTPTRGANRPLPELARAKPRKRGAHPMGPLLPIIALANGVERVVDGVKGFFGRFSRRSATRATPRGTQRVVPRVSREALTTRRGRSVEAPTSGVNGVIGRLRGTTARRAAERGTLRERSRRGR